MMKNSWPNYITTVHHITGRALNHNTYIWKLIFQILRFWPTQNSIPKLQKSDPRVNGMMMSSSFAAKIRVFKIEQLDFMPWTLIVSTTIGHTHIRIRNRLYKYMSTLYYIGHTYPRYKYLPNLTKKKSSI